jgi:hypothetical protein
VAITAVAAVKRAALFIPSSYQYKLWMKMEKPISRPYVLAAAAPDG